MRFRGQHLHASDQFGPHNKEKNRTARNGGRPSLKEGKLRVSREWRDGKGDLITTAIFEI